MGSEPNYQAEMQLPQDKSCADCRNVRRCVAFGFTAPDDTSCDFWPSRFVARLQPLTNHERFCGPFADSFAA